MKKVFTFLFALIIVSQIPICSFAYEATEEEFNASCAAKEFLNQCVFLLQETDEEAMEFYDNNTINFFNENIDMKNQILAKAKEYEDEIRLRHRYQYHEDNEAIWAYCDSMMQNGSYPADPYFLDHDENRPPTKQYDSIPIEDVITSYPDYLKKIYQYHKAYGLYCDVEISYCDFSFTPRSVYVSESGFAYVNNGTNYILMYKHETSPTGWLILDISCRFSEFDAKYRFHIDDLDIEKDLEERGIKPVGEKDTQIYPTAEEESDNKVDNSPQKSEPANYIPWVICTAEGVAIIALVIALILKKKK